MGKGIESWTDVDYAQAAIDMLPETVEEIAEFLVRHDINNPKYGMGCPIGKWVRRWTDTSAATVATLAMYVGFRALEHPPHVRSFIQAYDSHQITL